MLPTRRIRRSLLAYAACGLAALGCNTEEPFEDPPQSDAAVPNAVQSCDPQQVQPFPEGSPVWHASDVQQCDKACPNGDDACHANKCPDRPAHLACLADSLDACLTQPDGHCRATWESYLCCSVDACDASLDDRALEDCIAQSCADQLDAYARCADEVFSGKQADDTCLASATAGCLLPEDRAEMPDDAGHGPPNSDEGRTDDGGPDGARGHASMDDGGTPDAG